MAEQVRSDLENHPEEVHLFTLKIIFFGLFAFSPNEDTGLTVSMLDPDLGTIFCVRGDACIQSHVSAVIQTEGTCESLGNHECIRIFGEGQPFPPPPPPPPPPPETVYWFLDDEDLAIQGDLVQTWRAKGLPDGCLKQPMPFPNTAYDFDLSWLPNSSCLDSFMSSPRIKADCMGDQPTDCPSLSSRFRVDYGLAAACHLSHETIDKESLVIEYGFQDASGDWVDDYEQALADTVSVTMTVKDPYALLTSYDFDGRSSTEVKISPNWKKKQATLVVLSFPLPDIEPSHQHFTHFYDLAQRSRGSGGRAIPRMIGRKKLEPGSCEGALKKAEDRIEELCKSFPAVKPIFGFAPNDSCDGSRVVPHNIPECDSKLFRAP